MSVIYYVSTFILTGLFIIQEDGYLRHWLKNHKIALI